MRNLIPAAIACVLVPVASCAGGDGSGGAEDAIQIVAEDAIHVVGTAESIARIADLVPLPDGTVWVLNTVEPYFVALAPDGAVVRSWGKRGGGPDELRSPNALLVHEGSSEVWAYDRGSHMLVRVTGPESPVDLFPIPRDSIAPSRMVSTDNAGTGDGRYWIGGGPDGFIIARSRPGTSGMAQLWRVELMYLKRDGSLETVLAPADLVGDPSDRFGTASEFLPVPLWTLCADRSTALYDPLTNTVRRFSEAGEEMGSHALPAEQRLEITPDRVFQMVARQLVEQSAGAVTDTAQLRQFLRSQWREFSGEVASVFPEYADLHCAADNALWLQHFDVESGLIGRGPAWLRVDPSGGIREVRLPGSFRPMRFVGDRIWGIDRGEFDVESVAWVDVH